MVNKNRKVKYGVHTQRLDIVNVSLSFQQSGTFTFR